MQFKRVGISIAVLVLIYLLSLIGIYFGAPDPTITTFPEDCPPTPNCTRVAEFNVRGEGLRPLKLNATLREVHDAILNWIDVQPRTEILRDNGTFIHAKFLSFVFRFPDDLYVQLFCVGNQTSFWVQSQSRLGRGDLNVNEERVQSLFSFIESVEFELNSCS
ncbi:MAG: DUF1499 domain-containing protein [Methanobacteriota archaeon]|nr:MAG: DUF1499 domain-containing protein [Euryarchaeota archaeon]